MTTIIGLSGSLRAAHLIRSLRAAATMNAEGFRAAGQDDPRHPAL